MRDLGGYMTEDGSKVNYSLVYQNQNAISELNNGIKKLFNYNKSGISILNSLSFDRKDQIILKNTEFTPDNLAIQEYTDIYGDRCIAVEGSRLPSLSVSFIKSGKSKTISCPFKVDGNNISTPFADIIMEKGRFVSYKTKQGREVVANSNIPLNTLYFGEDIPFAWDNWDIDYDQYQKMEPVYDFVSSEVVSIGGLQLRIRVKYKFDNSMLSQDIVFYSDNPRIDFETLVDWNSSHSLIKTSFKVNVLSADARFETQFGNIKRPTHENYITDKTQFEVCNHKWTDLSDTRFGVANGTDFDYLYGTTYSMHKNDIVSSYKKYSKLLNKISDKKIVDYIIISDSVNETVFENGIKVFVNYGDDDYSSDEINVKSHSFNYVEGAK